jgi:hypothetical protein
MAIELNEPIIAEIKSRLVDDLPAAIAAINTERVDDVVLVAPAAEDILEFIPTPALLTVFPTIGVGDGGSRFEDDIGSSATGKHEILIVAYLQSAEQHELAVQLRRYMVAIARVILAGRNLDSAAWGTGLVGTYPGPTLTDNPEDPTEWMSWSGIRIWAKREE